MPDGHGAAPPPPPNVPATQALLSGGGYVADRALATAVHLALTMGRPLLLEGEPGTGKTEIAKVLAARLPRRLVRLQCHDGMDLSSAAYEWNHARQLMAIRLAEAAGEGDRATLERGLYDRRFLESRPLLQAIEGSPALLLIDELDRADEPFEAFLLEVLADYQITVPELGTIHADTPPVVIITSNRTREVHDAIRRRCLYHWVDYPDAARERAILHVRAPDVPRELSAQVVAFVQALRDGDQLFKPPGVAESVDWARALHALDERALEHAAAEATLGVLLKYQDDIAKLRGAELARRIEEARDAAAAVP
ncbi:AAA family ATPase [Roseomonas sp. CCTCC AB2023176]|uniref:AAA family ATPase n=1 Tax=Roseomonas sp. CCTCC AB2023176 TaxID=3342640 RepID=UPI0035E375D7